ncbi:MAG: RNA-binding S4 domain-containing protein [Arenicellales bacterium]|nr:RNA-binding S4 domain-containing protein [Arenicellales bacterium]
MVKQSIIEVRLDKWLYAARIFKTRQIAAKVITAGHIEVNGTGAKAARLVRVGDELSVRKGAYTYVLTIKGLSLRRGPASEAKRLYSETESSILERDRLSKELKTRAAQVLYDSRKPTKRDRRQARSRKRNQAVPDRH